MNGELMLSCTVCRGRSQHQKRCELPTAGGQRSIAMFTCNRCGRVLVIEAESERTVPDDTYVVYPRAVVARSGIPPAIAAALDEALIALNGGAWNLAVNGFRTVLQMAVREKGAKESALRAEIDDLTTRNLIPPSLAEWAHAVRSAANEAVHPDGPLPWKEEDASELLALTLSILDYLYVVPTTVEARRQRLAAP